MTEISTYLQAKTYPGRGIAIFAPGEDELLIAYWIMGRSTNSRNRIFDEIHEGAYAGKGLRTLAADDSLCDDPHLIIYNAALDCAEKNQLIVTNGDQTDTIYEGIVSAADVKCGFVSALETRTFEDDAPNFTPRISAMVDKGNLSVAMSILKCADPERETAARQYYFYEAIKPGCGRLVTTYVEDANPLPSFEGDPLEFTSEAKNADEFMGEVWTSLNEDNKISLMVACVKKGETAANFASYTNYVNKYKRQEA